MSATALLLAPLELRRNSARRIRRSLRGVIQLRRSPDAEGWIEQTGVTYLLRQTCIISLTLPLSFVSQAVTPQLARVTYVGGYVLPGTTPGAGQTALPDDLESAAVEQVAFWFQQRDKLGLIPEWPHDGTFVVLIQLSLLPQVSAMIRPHKRWAV